MLHLEALTHMYIYFCSPKIMFVYPKIRALSSVKIPLDARFMYVQMMCVPSS